MPIRFATVHNIPTLAEGGWSMHAPIPNIASSGGKPVVVDLNGDGFHFMDVDDSNVFFDVNGDGKITAMNEISFIPYAHEQLTDLAALKAAFDSNGDGQFDARDEKWASFGVWQDANCNGITDAGEFKSLDQLGISSISVTSNGQFQVIDGQTVHGAATASKSDGSTLAIADVTLRYTNQTQVLTHNADGSSSSTTVNLPNSAPGQELLGTAERDLVFGSHRYKLSIAIRTRYLGYRPISCHKWSKCPANNTYWSHAA